jgi:hypothetical protein
MRDTYMNLSYFKERVKQLQHDGQLEVASEMLYLLKIIEIQDDSLSRIRTSTQQVDTPVSSKLTKGVD